MIASHQPPAGVRNTEASNHSLKWLLARACKKTARLKEQSLDAKKRGLSTENENDANCWIIVVVLTIKGSLFRR